MPKIIESREYGMEQKYYKSSPSSCVICLLKIEAALVNLRDLMMTTKWKSCIIFTPKTATLIVAVYYVIVSVAIVGLSVAGYAMLNPIEVVERKDGKKTKESDEILLEGIVPAKVMLLFLTLTGLLSFITSIMLIMGAINEKSQWIYIWLNAHVFILGIHLLICFCNMFLELPDQTQKNIAIYGCVSNGMLTLYFLVVVNNFYGELEEKIPFGSYVENPYIFSNKIVSHNQQGYHPPEMRRFQP